MRYPRKRPPRRVWRWEGVADEVDGSTIWATLIPIDHDGPELQAEFPRSACPALAERQYLTLYVHRRGHKVHSALRPKQLPPFTEEQVARFLADGATHAVWMQQFVHDTFDEGDAPSGQAPSIE